MKARLQEDIAHLREDIRKVDEPQLKAMFETSAEVLTGLAKAFDDYERKNERRGAGRPRGQLSRKCSAILAAAREGDWTTRTSMAG